jgi:O-acetylserine/cysteine efflux transporter
VRPRHAALAILTSAIWGGAFVAIEIGLQSFSPPQLTALRFLIACLPVFVVPRPRISWTMFLCIGATLFAGQFLLLFFAYVNGMPPGLASITMQMQALFTVLIAAITLRETPTRRQIVGMLCAFGGLALIGSTLDSDLKLAGLLLTLGAALSWAIGNVLVKRTAKDASTVSLMAWLSLVPPIPAVIVSAYHDGAGAMLQALASASWQSIAAALYLGAIATTLAYAIWGNLLRRYATADVTPFALLAPCVGVAASAAFFGERFGAVRYGGMVLILVGLAIITMRTPGLVTQHRQDDRNPP